MSEHPSTKDNNLTFGMKALLFLTTSPCRLSEFVSPPLIALAEDMVRRGWWLRLATPRNYFLWRQGLNKRCGRYPVVVLAHPVPALSLPEIIVLFATDLLEAERRFAADKVAPARHDKQALDRFCTGIAMEKSGLAIVSRPHVFAAAERKLVDALQGY